MWHRPDACRRRPNPQCSDPLHAVRIVQCDGGVGPPQLAATSDLQAKLLLFSVLDPPGVSRASRHHMTRGSRYNMARKSREKMTTRSFQKIVHVPASRPPPQCPTEMNFGWVRMDVSDKSTMLRRVDDCRGRGPTFAGPLSLTSAVGSLSELARFVCRRSENAAGHLSRAPGPLSGRLCHAVPPRRDGTSPHSRDVPPP
jgi:hypothetical protein